MWRERDLDDADEEEVLSLRTAALLHKALSYVREARPAFSLGAVPLFTGDVQDLFTT